MLVQDMGNSLPVIVVMSKARVIILSVEVEGLSQSEAAVLYGVSKSWVSKLMARYRTEGDAAFEPKSRRPHRTPLLTVASGTTVARAELARRPVLATAVDAPSVHVGLD